ncbi:ABC transporter ATP-binding protein [Paenibacillus sp. GCM10027627]|uniref:ABC transporter ATP-binding protein n=1 Tax=unclassified Paenibacillus TaxID=185978 RepID=UPI00363ED172
MRTVFGFLKRYRIAAAAAVALMLAELVIELAQPLLMAKIVDEGIRQGRSDLVLLWGGVMLGGAVIAFAVGILSSFYAAHVSQSFGFDIRGGLFKKVQSLSYANFSRFQQSSLMTRLTGDIVGLQNTVFMGLRIMLRAPLFVAGSVVMAFIVNPRIAIWFAGALPFIGLFLVWILKRGEGLFQAVQQQLDKVNGILRQNLTGMRLIRVFVRSQHESKKFEAASSGLASRTIAALRFTELMMPIVLLVMNGAIIAILWIGRAQLSTGEATVGEVVAIVNYATRTAGALSLVSMIVLHFTKAKASARRIEEVMEAYGDETGVEESSLLANRGDWDDLISKGEVQFRNVAFQYPDTDEPLLKYISFHAAQGETIAVLGATGSGKSTLLQLIPRLYEVQEGAIWIDGLDSRNRKLRSLRDGIGYVPQDIMLFTGSVADNIRRGKEDATLEEMMEAARKAQIHETIMQFEDGYETIVGQKGVNLSGGQKQRLTIARALVRKPSILLLDDCTSALDIHTENALLRGLKAVGCTTLFVTQKMSSTASADRILLLDEGRLLASGTHEQLLNDSELYQKIFRSQNRKAGAAHA